MWNFFKIINTHNNEIIRKYDKWIIIIIIIIMYWERPEYWEETCCHSDSGEKPSANADVKNSNE